MRTATYNTPDIVACVHVCTHACKFHTFAYIHITHRQTDLCFTYTHIDINTITHTHTKQTSVQVTYTSTGSGTGKKMLSANQISFAGSDSPVSKSDKAVVLRQQRMIPIFAAGVGVMYNNKNVDDLTLTRKAVNDIFLGSINSWNNPSIMGSNPGKSWSNEAIVRVVRADGSGTTETLAKALYFFADIPGSTAFSKHPLAGAQLPTWPVAATPFSDGASCVFKNCTKAVCSPGFYLDEVEDACMECPLVRSGCQCAYVCTCLCIVMRLRMRVCIDPLVRPGFQCAYVCTF
jgi:hypothetical protein